MSSSNPEQVEEGRACDWSRGTIRYCVGSLNHIVKKGYGASQLCVKGSTEVREEDMPSDFH